MPTQKEIKTKLIEVLVKIQKISGYSSDGISGTTSPFKDLEGFDSQISVESICELSTSLGIDIPDDENIFISHDSTQLLTVDEIANQVCKILNN